MDNTESFIADDIVSDVLKIEIENGMKLTFNLKCDVFSNTVFKYIFSSEGDSILLTQIEVREEKQSGNNTCTARLSK